MDKIKAQANKVGQLLFSADTGAAYKKVLILTWDILRETGILLWLVLCLLFVGIEWFYLTSIQLGQRARLWYENLGNKSQVSEAESAASTGEAIIQAGQSGLTYLLTQARQQLGMKTPDKPAAPPSAAPAAKPAPQPEPAPAAATPAPKDDQPKTPEKTEESEKAEQS